MIKNLDDLIALRTGRKVPQRSGDYWSPEEQEKLKRCFLEDGAGLSEMALEFERTEIAIYQQLDKAGLLAQQCKSRNRRPKNSEKPRCSCPTCTVTSCQNCGKECPNAGGI